MNLPGILTNAARAPVRRAASSIPLVAVLASTCALLFGTPAWSGKLPLERLFSAPDLSGPSLRGVKISPDGRLVAYLKTRDDDKDRFDLWAYDVSAQRHRQLVDSRTLAGADRALSAEEEARRERQRTSAYSGIVEYSFAPDSRHLLIPLNGDLYVYDLAAKPRPGRVAPDDHRGLRNRRTLLAALALRELRPRPESLRHRSREWHRARHHPERRRPGELRHGGIHRTGGDGSRHGLLVVARRAPHRAGARR